MDEQNYNKILDFMKCTYGLNRQIIFNIHVNMNQIQVSVEAIFLFLSHVACLSVVECKTTWAALEKITELWCKINKFQGKNAKVDNQQGVWKCYHKPRLFIWRLNFVHDIFIQIL